MVKDKKPMLFFTVFFLYQKMSTILLWPKRASIREVLQAAAIFVYFITTVLLYLYITGGGHNEIYIEEAPKLVEMPPGFLSDLL